MTATGGDVPIPRAFLEMPRWWHEGAQWLAELPRLIDEQCRRWNLHVTGAARHGSNALVVPVVRSGTPLVLRLTPRAPS